jgi:hypothetical protein
MCSSLHLRSSEDVYVSLRRVAQTGNTRVTHDLIDLQTLMHLHISTRNMTKISYIYSYIFVRVLYISLSNYCYLVIIPEFC